MTRSIVLPAAPRATQEAEVDAIKLDVDGGLHLLFSDGRRAYVAARENAEEGFATAEDLLAALGAAVPSRIIVGRPLIRREFRINGRRRVIFAEMESRAQ